MIYPDFNNIIINNTVGVSPVGSDTLLIAQHVTQLEFVHALEIGIGTGFIPIYLKTRGQQCDGTDISTQAISCASENAKLNHLDLKFYRSDLFSNIHNKFDLVIFNPPYGHVSSKFFSRPFEIAKSLLPKENPLISKIAYNLIRKNRRLLISRFLEKVRDVLTQPGNIVILLHHTEFDLIQHYKYYMLSALEQQQLVLLENFHE